jgi:hypothetical protein
MSPAARNAILDGIVESDRTTDHDLKAASAPVSINITNSGTINIYCDRSTGIAPDGMPWPVS